MRVPCGGRTLLFKTRKGRQVDIGELGKAYNACFRNNHGVAYVLPDIAEFCHAQEPLPRVGDLYTLGIAAGLLDVFCHFRELLELDEAELVDLYKGRSIPVRPNTEPER